jgi:hypothetical protein
MRKKFYEKTINELAFFLLDDDFSKALKSFFSDMGTKNYSLGAKKNSVFVLVKKHLDEPFKKALLISVKPNYTPFYPNICLLPSSMEKLAPGHEALNADTLFTDYQKSVYILNSWVMASKNLQEWANDSTRLKILEILEYLAMYLKEFRPRKIHHRSNRTDNELVRTEAAHAKINQYCELCENETILFQKDMKDGLTAGEWNSSSQYCESHLKKASSDSSGANYNSHIKYKNDYQRELLSIHNPGTSVFYPEFKWFANYYPFMDQLRFRRTARMLVSSKLNFKIRSRNNMILRLLCEDDTEKSIAEKLGIHPKTVRRRINSIVSEVRSVLASSLLDLNPHELTKHSDDSLEWCILKKLKKQTIEVRSTNLEFLALTPRFNYQLLSNEMVKNFLLIDEPFFPKLPTLVDILDATRESLIQNPELSSY